MEGGRGTTREGLGGRDPYTFCGMVYVCPVSDRFFFFAFIPQSPEEELLSKIIKITPAVP